MTCFACGYQLAGLRYRLLEREYWFHARCWRWARVCDSRFSVSTTLLDKAKRGRIVTTNRADTANVRPILVTQPSEVADMTSTHVTTGVQSDGC